MLYLKSTTSDESGDSATHPKTGFLPRRYKTDFTFITHQGFNAQILAYMLDSLVRVSRRVNENHFIRIAKARMTGSITVPSFVNRTALLSKSTNRAGNGVTSSSK